MFPFTRVDFQAEVKSLLSIAIPILIAQLAIAGLGVADTIMSGQVGTDDLAAIGLGSSILFPIMMLAIGMLMPLTPMIAKQQAKQETKQDTKDETVLISDNLPQTLSQGIWLAIPIGVVMWFLLHNADWLLNYLPLTPSVFKLTDQYLDFIAWGLPGLGFYFVYRFFWEGLSLTLPTMLISLGALALNVPLNAVFIYGLGPVKAYGAAGCGIASAIVMWMMLVVAIIYVYKGLPKRGFHLSGLTAPKWVEGIRTLLIMGIPNTLALLFEASLFSLIALFIAKLGTVVIAANQIALSFSSLMFMMPLSLSLAVTIRTGQAFGQGNLQTVKTRIYSAVLFSGFVGLAVALFTYCFRQELVLLYNDNPEVIHLAMVLLVIAAFYQVFDAIQVTIAGALRGLHSTHVTMWVTLIGYWGLGLGGGYFLTFGSPWHQPLGVAGFWIGIVIGFVFAAIVLQSWLTKLIHLLVQKGELV